MLVYFNVAPHGGTWRAQSYFFGGAWYKKFENDSPLPQRGTCGRFLFNSHGEGDLRNVFLHMKLSR